MGGYAPTPKKGKQLDLRPIATLDDNPDFSIACGLCTNPSRSGVDISHTDGSGVECTDTVICGGCLGELEDFSKSAP